MGKRSYNTLEEMQEVCRQAKQRAKEFQNRRNEQIRATSTLPYSFTYKMRNAFIGKVCPVCGRRMGVLIREEEDPVAIVTPYPSIQHNIPLHKGGKHTIENISVICRSCNSRIKDNITGDLNNEEVRRVWESIKV